MKRLALLLPFVLWCAATAAPPPTVPCATCHDDPSAWARKAVVHAPVREGKCTGCHAPHASSHPGLMRRGGTRACRPCHESLFRRIDTGLAHAALESGKACLACHEPHASDRPKLLAAEPAVLCRTCHESVAKPPAHAHPPASKGDCLACHDPHGAPLPDLARKKEPELCIPCHRLGDPKIAAAHRGLLGPATRCSSCHDPHGSDGAGMIRPVAHLPFAAGDCRVCHLPAKAGARAGPGRGATAECTTCHEPFAGGHPTTSAISCMSCHTPHASSAAALVRGPEKEVCLACHREVGARRAGAVSFHPPAGGLRDCTLCHGIHSARGPGLVRKADADALCSSCHSAHAQFSHPMGEGVPDRSHPGRPVGCLSCHDPHGTSLPQFLLADPRQDLCLRCHAEGIR